MCTPLHTTVCTKGNLLITPDARKTRSVAETSIITRQSIIVGITKIIRSHVTTLTMLPRSAVRVVLGNFSVD